MPPPPFRSNIRSLALAGAAIALLAPAAGAATLDFDFSFENLGNGGGTVTGVMRGLTDDATGPASSVEVLTHTDGFGIGEYVGSPDFNSWTVAGGAITGISFLSFGVSNEPPAVTDATIRLGDLFVGLTTETNRISPTRDARDTLTFTSRSEPAAVIPLPAAGWLLLAGLGALAGLRARRRAA